MRWRVLSKLSFDSWRAPNTHSIPSINKQPAAIDRLQQHTITQMLISASEVHRLLNFKRRWNPSDIGPQKTDYLSCLYVLLLSFSSLSVGFTSHITHFLPK